jgi:hypothetical protein
MTIVKIEEMVDDGTYIAISNYRSVPSPTG